ncbi:MAG TPA: hypothetical protein IGS53_06895 [Leptolyngbyaceae cyanobacterium M33_DOE_097]|uniref:Uncharacterized protein n=1 Tax=Oscillatoriales cyanobacterium SpSt-418 TaxID=2282169 RepID=A0A7C3PGP5_9CYAN|nr:hypothetical protein [Leptolyngbyaceae cyanobacterium M33_DOE_097]
MKSQWQNYRNLEQIDSEIAPPPAKQTLLSRLLSYFWRSRLNRYTEQLSSVRQIEHLEACFADQPKSLKQHLLRLWQVLLQPLFHREQKPAKPHVWQSRSWNGEDRWHVYDPISGQTTVLLSEQDLLIWLESHSYQ